VALKKRDDERDRRLEDRLIQLKAAMGDAMIQATSSSVIALQQNLMKRDEELSEALRHRDSAQAQALCDLQQSIISQMSTKFSGFMLSLVGHLNSTITAAVAAGLGLRGRLKNRMVRDSKINKPCCQDFTP
jgi:hypothetical protein